MRIWLQALVALALIVPMASRAGDDAEAGGVRALAGGNQDFAFDLYGRLKGQPGNLFFSPYSISACLGMTYAGASGTTASQMARVLHFTGSQDQVASAFGDLQRQFNGVEQKQGIELNIANGLWAQEGHPFLPSFMAIAQTAYQARVNQVDFRTQAEPVREEVNSWVSRQTRGKISDLLPPGAVQATTRLLLVNAIYFKGEWTRQFNQTNTASAPFWVSSSQSVPTPLMHLSASFNYADTGPLQLLELPYAGGQLEMVVLLPKTRGGLSAVEASLNSASLNAWLAQAHTQKVNVFLPKFKLAAQFSLGHTLAEMGMTDAFSRAADFSQMDGARDLFISAVVHKAFVDVTEKGTEAAAATGAVIRMLAVRRQPVATFRADHPFVFLIRDTQSGSVLFLGRLAEPVKE